MNLRIKQCKKCPQNDECEYRDSIRKEVRGVMPGQVAVIRCKRYPQVFSRGDRVSLMTYNRVNVDSPDGPYAYWEEHETVTGSVTGVVKKDLFEVTLDSPVTVIRNGTEQVELATYRKEARGLTLIHKAEMTVDF